MLILTGFLDLSAMLFYNEIIGFCGMRRRTYRYMNTEKQRKFLINIAYWAVIVVSALIILQYLLPLLWPFVAGFVVAYLLKTPIQKLQQKTKLSRKLCAIITVTLFFVVLGGLMTLLGVQLISSAADTLRSIPDLYNEHIQPFFMEVFVNAEEMLMEWDVSLVSVMNNLSGEFFSSMGSMVSNLSVKAMGLVSGLASALPGLFIGLVLLIVAAFFIAIDYDILRGFCLRQMNDKAMNLFLEIKKYVIGTLWVCIRSYALIMSITFLEIALGLYLLKVPYGALIAAVIAIFDILPIVGTGGIMLPWAFLAAVSGNFKLGLGLLLLYVVITIIRNIIEPKIVGNQLGLHPIVTLAVMFAGAQLMGVVGVFGFPIGLSLLMHLNKRGVVKVFK